MKTETKPTFDHNGVTITLEASGKFSAMSPTGRITSGSLDGIKKRLDKDGVFEPFKAFTFNNGYSRGEELRECTVIGFAEPRRRYGVRAWKVKDADGTYTRELSEVYEDTPANRAAAKAYMDTAKANRKLREQQDEAERKAMAKIKARKPEAKKT